MFKPVTEWIEFVNAVRAGDRDVLDSPFGRAVMRIYGDRPEILLQRMTLIRRALVAFGQKYGRQSSVAVVRCPGRINLMGRHVDHQGGHCNPLAIDRELVMVVQPRRDDIVELSNVDQVSFPPRWFSLSELNRRLPADEWKRFVDAQTTADFLAQNAGCWSVYVLAAILRLQNRFPERDFRGMSLMVAGDIPIASGLSSSSALVVAAAEAAVLINGLPVEVDEFPVLLGEGEWFVGTRGGFNDHAAMKLAQRGSVLKVKFFDFAVEDVVRFPPECCLVICDSGTKAKKSEGRKNIYNAKVTAYAMAKALIKRDNPEWASAIEHFRDFHPSALGTTLAEVYRVVFRLPRKMSREAFRQALPPEQRRETEALFASHREPESGYDVRGVALFGLAECERSRLCAEYLQRSDVEGLGRLMNVSHNGDRVACHAEGNQRQESPATETDEQILDLIERAESDDAAVRESAAIHLQAGSYRCSTPRVDLIVDVARVTTGVYGAQLSGAGLGGCAMVLLDQGACGELKRNLAATCLCRGELDSSFLVCTPIGGSGPLLLE
jgi:N-acetylgalactosamine kinase